MQKGEPLLCVWILQRGVLMLFSSQDWVDIRYLLAKRRFNAVAVVVAVVAAVAVLHPG